MKLFVATIEGNYELTIKIVSAESRDRALQILCPDGYIPQPPIREHYDSDENYNYMLEIFDQYYRVHSTRYSIMIQEVEPKDDDVIYDSGDICTG